MNPELSRELAPILGQHPVSIAERQAVIDAAGDTVARVDDLPREIRQLLNEISARQGLSR